MQYNLELSHSHQSQNQWPSHSCQRAMRHPHPQPPRFHALCHVWPPPKDPSLSKRILPGSWVPRAGLFLLASFLVSHPRSSHCLGLGYPLASVSPALFPRCGGGGGGSHKLSRYNLLSSLIPKFPSLPTSMDSPPVGSQSLTQGWAGCVPWRYLWPSSLGALGIIPSEFSPSPHLPPHVPWEIDPF